MLKKVRYSFIAGVTATVVVFVPITSSWAYAANATEYVEEYLLLEVGSQGEEVVELKEALLALGFEIDLDIDEVDYDLFDEETEEQVKLLQEYYEYEVTGFVDEELFEFILDEAKQVELDSSEDAEKEEANVESEQTEVDEQAKELVEEQEEMAEAKEETIEEVEEAQEQGTEEEMITEEEATVAMTSVDVDSENVLKDGDRDPRVVELKINLEIMGFKVSNNPTQLYGSMTARKVSEFQEAYGLPVTGMADEVTFQTLEDLANGPLRQGMYRDDVVQLKVDLETLGFGVSSNPTRFFGSITASQVRAFQEAYGLPVDGIAGVATLNKIEELLAKASISMTDADVIQLKVNLGIMGFRVSSNPNGNYGPITTQKVAEFQKAYGLPVTGNADRVTVERLNELATGPLRQGMHRDDVVQLKIDLGKLGFVVPGNTTTFFGSQTTSQLIAFQEAYGLNPDGIAGKSTVDLLNELTATVLSEGMRDPRVIDLKMNLAILGFSVSSNPTSLYGPITASQVSDFQTAYRLPVTGIADQRTISKLNELATGPMQQGMYRDDVIQLKIDLEAAGFFVSSNPNNYFGPSTASQLKAFQKAHGLTADGVANEATLNKLKQAKANNLYIGMNDPRVVDLKINLAIMGFGVSSNPTGLYGSITRSQVSDFQAAYGLPVTGVADPDTVALLNELANGPLRVGMYRDDVVELKEMLARAGFGVSSSLTNYFGPITERQLRDFQAAYGLEVTGIADAETLAKLAEVAPQEKITYMQSNFTMTQSIERQLTLNPPPQTDAYRNAPAFVSASLVELEGTISGSTVNLRTAPRLGSATIETSVSQGTKMTVLKEVTGDLTGGSDKWYEVRYNGKTLYAHAPLMNVVAKTTANNVAIREAANGSSHAYSFVRSGTSLNVTSLGATWHQISFTTWRNAKQEDFIPYMDPNNHDRFQHLVLSSSAGVSAEQLNRLLTGKGVLQGLGQAFIDAGASHSVNEVYLISHALLETGHGASSLATGIEVGKNSSGELELVTSSNRSRLTEIRTTHNMFGINAVDADPYRQGAFHAYRQGWFTPEAAIIGGAQFIGSRYIHNSHKQNTLYKMRWNPANPGFPQYATDMAWAVKQVPNIKKLYDELDNPVLHFEFVQYK
ncbi:peptidoglycan-binding protein [Halalkalibacter krulwichiae]|uniref:Beta-N-acetylglucosaminidase n=1 Tax=Halalkalibacter krulwichiae TaxID=199441 RepID=A0A1X9MKK7_9BACI|nr:peptidoglycan-binding protein [Halalkalibacter krulwichiae]ARK32201.1 Beta-N-acetylglucosaminidase precursor [Halalkalibacter krulwichiae]